MNMYITIQSFNNPVKECFWKYCGKEYAGNQNFNHFQQVSSVFSEGKDIWKTSEFLSVNSFSMDVSEILLFINELTRVYK